MFRSARFLDAFGTLLRLGLAAVWLFAGVPKLADGEQNFLAVRAYELFPDDMSRFIAGTQPFLEIALALLLILGVGVRFVAVLSGIVLLVYIAGIIQAWARGLTIDCGCFSSGGQVNSGETQYPEDIARDVGFLAMAVWLSVRPRSMAAIDGLLARPRPAEPETAQREEVT